MAKYDGAVEKIAPDSKIAFVDDGGGDRTWALIERAAASPARAGGIKLSRNRGHQNAVLAGMMTVDGDAMVTIDADLQDDIEAIERMVDAHLDGCDAVYGVRADRSTDSAFKRSSATHAQGGANVVQAVIARCGRRRHSGNRLGWKSYLCAISAIIMSPRVASSATLALSAVESLRSGRL